MRPNIHNYAVDIRALYRHGDLNTWVFEFVVWRYVNQGRGGIPPQVFNRMDFTGTQDAAREASQAFLDLVKIKEEG